MIVETRELERCSRRRTSLPGSTIGGSDVDHDWPWWHMQLSYFMDRWLENDARDPR